MRSQDVARIIENVPGPEGPAELLVHRIGPQRSTRCLSEREGRSSWWPPTTSQVPRPLRGRSPGSKLRSLMPASSGAARSEGGGARSWGALARSRRGPNQIRREKVGQPVNLNDESWKQR